MYGYIFLAECKSNGKKFIGKFASVKFNKLYFGDNPGLISDVEKYGKENFTVKMIRACETAPEYEMAYDMFLNQYNALTDSNFYNYVESDTGDDAGSDVAPKKRRRKKVVEE